MDLLKHSTTLGFLVASALVLGCGDGADTVDLTTPLEPEVRFDTTAYTLKPGEEKRYLCYTMRLPADKETVIKEIVPTYGKGIHHLGIYYTLATEPEGVSECPQLYSDTWIPLYGGGIESGTLKLPEGSGFRMPKNQQIIVQLHLLNASDTDIEDKATITFKTADPAADVKRAGMFGFDNRTLKIPPHSTAHEQVMSCPNVGKEMDVFAVFGHMHQFGKHIEASRGAKPGDEILYKTDWIFDNQPTTPASFHVSAKDSIHLRCTYDNHADMELAYGESTFSEMCSFVFYYTPFEALDGCVQTP